MGKVADAAAKMIANLEANSGKPLAAWIKLVQARKFEKHGEMVAFLKSNHGLGHGYANIVAHAVLDARAPDAGDDSIARQYEGAKEALLPIYVAVLAAVHNFGLDIEVSPKKAYVSLRRNKQFAILQPSTATRMDIGLNLKRVAPAGRLEASGSFNAMVSHRVRVESGMQVDKQLVGWLKQAYEQA